MSYETLDAIADSYIPLLAIIFFTVWFHRLYKCWPGYQSILINFSYLLALLAIAYSVMFLDNAIHLWPRLGLDYSTHTAVALSLVFAISALLPATWKVLAVSMIAYAGLMLYQQYHSLLDIISTGIIVGASAFYLLIRVRRLARENASHR